MPEWGERFAADKSEGTVLVLFVPSVDREEEPIDQADRLRSFLVRMGEQTRQGAVGFVIDQTYLEIRFRDRED